MQARQAEFDYMGYEYMRVTAERFSVYRPFKHGWRTVTHIETFDEAVTEAERGCRYAKKHPTENDHEYLVKIGQEIMVENNWYAWHGWYMHTEHDILDYDNPKLRSTPAWENYELQQSNDMRDTKTE